MTEEASVFGWCSPFKTNLWFTMLNTTPNAIWLTPKMTESFILKEFKAVILLEDNAQTCSNQTQCCNIAMYMD